MVSFCFSIELSPKSTSAFEDFQKVIDLKINFEKEIYVNYKKSVLVCFLSCDNFKFLLLLNEQTEHWFPY